MVSQIWNKICNEHYLQFDIYLFYVEFSEHIEFIQNMLETGMYAPSLNFSCYIFN